VVTQNNKPQITQRKLLVAGACVLVAEREEPAGAVLSESDMVRSLREYTETRQALFHQHPTCMILSHL
jgi:hypothetical protein